MHKLPSIVFVLDQRKEKIAVAEGRKLGIPVVSLVDTNCDPDEVDYVIPGNDDAIRAANLICRVIADAVIEGEAIRAARLAEEMEQKAEEGKDKATARRSDTVPAFSASPEDIGGPDITPVYSGDPTEEGAEEDALKAEETVVGETREVEPEDAPGEKAPGAPTGDSKQVE